MASLGPVRGPILGPRLGPNPTSGPLSIRIVAHGLTTGDGPFYVNTTGARPAPLAAAGYYAIVVDADHLQMASSRVNALAETAIELTDAGTGVHTIDTQSATASALTALVGYADTFTSSFGDGWVDLDESGDPRTEVMADGDGPVLVSTTIARPAPLLGGVEYWLIHVDGPPSGAGSSRRFAASYADAVARTEIVLLSDGLGTHTITSQPGAEHRAAVTLANFTVFTVS